jgi:hypothetical protein
MAKPASASHAEPVSNLEWLGNHSNTQLPAHRQAQVCWLSAIDVFRERAEARATLVAHGLMDLQSAVDGMQKVAEAQGLIKQYGQDAIQQILAESFARWRYG